MKIYGVGTDIVSVDRIKKVVKNKSFLKRLFSEKEIYRCSKLINANNCFAKRFAAKEAFSKALGTGISNGISFKDISVINNKKGKPYIELFGKTKSVVKSILKIKYKIFLSLSDEKNYALAMVVISY